jgi:hypothetical protein
VLKSKDYLESLRTRAKKSRIYRKFQLLGLEMAQVLEDEEHTSLYMKLAKEGDGEELLRIAKDIAGRRRIKNKGAYFMTYLAEEKDLWKKKKNKTTQS